MTQKRSLFSLIPSAGIDDDHYPGDDDLEDIVASLEPTSSPSKPEHLHAPSSPTFLSTRVHLAPTSPSPIRALAGTSAFGAQASPTTTPKHRAECCPADGPCTKLLCLSKVLPRSSARRASTVIKRPLSAHSFPPSSGINKRRIATESCCTASSIEKHILPLVVRSPGCYAVKGRDSLVYKSLYGISFKI